MVGERFLKKLGYEVIVAQTGAEGLSMFNANRNSLHLIITDHNMPEMLGLEFATEVRKIDPKIPIILVTGFADLTDMDMARQLAVCEVLHKPYGTEILATAVRRALGIT